MADIEFRLVNSSFPNLSEAMKACGKYANMCYSEGTWGDIEKEPGGKSLVRAHNAVISGHHSIFEHPSLTFYMRGIPKLLAMAFNNEGLYDTSEKSARYTVMEPVGLEKELYDKWRVILEEMIATLFQEDDRYDKGRVTKLAQENARYMISVFTPTQMIHTLNLRRLNYLRCDMLDFVVNTNHELTKMLAPSMYEFVDQTAAWSVEGMNGRKKDEVLSLFASHPLEEESLKADYAITYKGSFAHYAQTHRHRTVHYQMVWPEVTKAEFYVPPIVKNFDKEEEWLQDLELLRGHYPQAMMVQIIERGRIEDFTLKLMERLCSEAQHEISHQSFITLLRFLEAGLGEKYPKLKKLERGARCGAGYKCTKACKFGSHQIERMV